MNSCATSLRLVTMHSTHSRSAICHVSDAARTRCTIITAYPSLTMFNQYDQIAAKLLPAIEAATIKPKIMPPIGEPLSAKRGAKVNLAN